MVCLLHSEDSTIVFGSSVTSLNSLLYRLIWGRVLGIAFVKRVTCWPSLSEEILSEIIFLQDFYLFPVISDNIILFCDSFFNLISF